MSQRNPTIMDAQIKDALLPCFYGSCEHEDRENGAACEKHILTWVAAHMTPTPSAAAPALGAALVERVKEAVKPILETAIQANVEGWSMSKALRGADDEIARAALCEVEPILTWDAEKISALIDERNAAQAEVRRLTEARSPEARDA